MPQLIHSLLPKAFEWKDMMIPFSKSLSLFMILLLFSFYGSGCDSSSPSPQSAVHSCRLEIRFQPSTYPTQIQIQGQLGSRTQVPLTLLDESRNEWGVDLLLDQGRYWYRIEVDGRNYLDPSRPLSFRNQGQEYSLVEHHGCTQGTWYRVKRDFNAPHWTYTLAYKRALNQNEEPIALDVKSLNLTIDQKEVPFNLDGEVLSFQTNGFEYGKHHVRLTGKDQNQTPFKPFYAPFWIEDEEFRWNHGLLYQVVLDRFSPPKARMLWQETGRLEIHP